MKLLEGPLGSATFSDCGTWRYELTRRVNEFEAGRELLACGLNPSKATHEREDLTVTKLQGWARLWMFGRLTVVNAFALIGTDPACLERHSDPVGPDNDAAITAAARRADVILVAWGDGGNFKDRAEVLNRIFIASGKPLKCFGRTLRGSPRHPSRLAYATALENWRTP